MHAHQDGQTTSSYTPLSHKKLHQHKRAANINLQNGSNESMVERFSARQPHLDLQSTSQMVELDQFVPGIGANNTTISRENSVRKNMQNAREKVDVGIGGKVGVGIGGNVNSTCVNVTGGEAGYWEGDTYHLEGCVLRRVSVEEARACLRDKSILMVCMYVCMHVCMYVCM